MHPKLINRPKNVFGLKGVCAHVQKPIYLIFFSQNEWNALSQVTNIHVTKHIISIWKYIPWFVGTVFLYFFIVFVFFLVYSFHTQHVLWSTFQFWVKNNVKSQIFENSNTPTLSLKEMLLSIFVSHATRGRRPENAFLCLIQTPTQFRVPFSGWNVIPRFLKLEQNYPFYDEQKRIMYTCSKT